MPTTFFVQRFTAPRGFGYWDVWESQLKWLKQVKDPIKFITSCPVCYPGCGSWGIVRHGWPQCVSDGKLWPPLDKGGQERWGHDQEVESGPALVGWTLGVVLENINEIQSFWLFIRGLFNWPGLPKLAKLQACLPFSLLFNCYMCF